MNLIDPYGLYVFYWGAGATAGAGQPKEGDTPNYFSLSGLVVSGTNKNGCEEEGLAGQLGVGRIGGLTLGAGLMAGWFRDDMEDFSGRGTAAGLTLGFVNVELTFNENTTRWTGFNVGLFKSIGFGLYGAETRSATRTHPTHRGKIRD